jgi:phosphoribosylanthranilate isomerase
MALETFVKINGITNLTDARYCSGMYVNLLGFTFEVGSDRFVSTTTFKEISGWVSGVDFVAEFEWASSEEVQNNLAICSEIKWLEHKRIETLLAFQEKGLNLIYKCSLEELADLGQKLLNELANSEVIIHVSDLKSSLSKEDEHRIKKLGIQQKIILGTGLNVSNVEQLIKDLKLFGISMTGGDEIKPGLMDFNELADILEALEVED